MGNRKKAVTTSGVAEVKHYRVSAGEMPTSLQEANESSNPSVESLATESSPSIGTP
jgi:hypothetical protein